MMRFRSFLWQGNSPPVRLWIRALHRLRPGEGVHKVKVTCIGLIGCPVGIAACLEDSQMPSPGRHAWTLHAWTSAKVWTVTVAYELHSEGSTLPCNIALRNWQELSHCSVWQVMNVFRRTMSSLCRNLSAGARELRLVKSSESSNCIILYFIAKCTTFLILRVPDSALACRTITSAASLGAAEADPVQLKQLPSFGRNAFQVDVLPADPVQDAGPDQWPENRVLPDLVPSPHPHHPRSGRSLRSCELWPILSVFSAFHYCRRAWLYRRVAKRLKICRSFEFVFKVAVYESQALAQ